MNLRSMFEQAQIQIGQDLNYAEFFAALVRTVSRCNLEADKPYSIVTIASSVTDAPLLPDDDEVISDDERIIGENRWLDGLVWDSLTNCVLLPQTYTRIDKLWWDDIRMESVPYDVLKQRDLEDYSFTNVNRHIYFAGDADSSSAVIKLRVKIDYDKPVKGVYEYNGMPDSAETMLMNGILHILYTMPKYFNTTQLGVYRTAFNQDVAAYSAQVLIKEPQEHQEPIYTF